MTGSGAKETLIRIGAIVLLSAVLALPFFGIALLFVDLVFTAFVFPLWTLYAVAYIGTFIALCIKAAKRRIREAAEEAAVGGFVTEEQRRWREQQERQAANGTFWDRDRIKLRRPPIKDPRRDFRVIDGGKKDPPRRK